jgi:hypothetical protein
VKNFLKLLGHALLGGAAAGAGVELTGGDAFQTLLPVIVSGATSVVSLISSKPSKADIAKVFGHAALGGIATGLAAAIGGPITLAGIIAPAIAGAASSIVSLFVHPPRKLE